MTKNDLVDKIWQNVDLKKKEIELVVDQLFQELEQCMLEEERVNIKGFGAFEVRKRMSRKDPNKKVKGVHFECSRVLTKKINQQ